jgi:hypothetical protein
VAPPTPLAFVLLAVLLPGVWLAGSAIAGRLSRERSLARVLTPALAVALWLVAIHAVSLGARSFWIGLPIGTLVVAAGGALSWLRPLAAPAAVGAPPAAPRALAAPRRKRGASRPRGSARGGSDQPPPAGYPASTGRWMCLSALLATAYLAPTALDWSFHDELAVTGHFSIASEIENGTYPPRHLSFPELELRYHYGFDLLVAAVASIFRLRVDHAIDLVTLIAWAYTWCLAWTAGERLVGKNWGAPTAAVVLFGGGMPFFSSAPSHFSTQTLLSAQALLLRLLSLGGVGDDDLNPPVVSYFFQHPWTLGIPLAFAIILVVSLRDAPRRWARWGAIGILLVALSFCQVVLFACLAGALLVAEPVAEGKSRWRSALAGLCVMGVVVAIASRLHGFFSPAPAGSESVLELRPLPLGGSVAGSVIWHLQTFGLLLPFGAVGLLLLARERLLVALLAAGSLLVVNALRYRFSWDIVKFATVAALALSLGAGAALRRLVAMRPRPLWRAAAVVAFVGLVAAGVLFPLVVGFSGQDVPFPKSPVALSAADQLAIDWLRRRVHPGEIVYRRGPAANGYTQWGGLPQVGYDHDATTFGLPRRLFEERTRFYGTGVSEPEALLRQRVRWLVFERADEAMARLVDSWTGNHRAIVRAQFGSLTIVELPGAIPAP